MPAATGRPLQRPAARRLLAAAGLVAAVALWPVLRDPPPRAPVPGVRPAVAPATAPRPSAAPPPADFGPEAAAADRPRPHRRRRHRRHRRRPHHPAARGAPVPRRPAAPAPPPAPPAPAAPAATPPSAGEFFAG